MSRPGRGVLASFVGAMPIRYPLSSRLTIARGVAKRPIRRPLLSSTLAVFGRRVAVESLVIAPGIRGGLDPIESFPDRIRGTMAGVGRPKLAAWMEPFRQGFTNPTWRHVLVLITGAILSP